MKADTTQDGQAMDWAAEFGHDDFAEWVNSIPQWEPIALEPFSLDALGLEAWEPLELAPWEGLAKLLEAWEPIALEPLDFLTYGQGEGLTKKKRRRRGSPVTCDNFHYQK